MAPKKKTYFENLSMVWGDPHPWFGRRPDFLRLLLHPSLSNRYFLVSWYLNCFPCKTSQTDSVGLPSGRASPLWGGDGGARSSLDVSFRQTQVLVALNRLQTSNMVDSAFPHSVFHPMLFSKIIIWWHFPQETDVLQVQMLQSLTLETWQLTSWHLAHGS